MKNSRNLQSFKLAFFILCDVIRLVAVKIEINVPTYVPKRIPF